MKKKLRIFIFVFGISLAFLTSISIAGASYFSTLSKTIEPQAMRLIVEVEGTPDLARRMSILSAEDQTEKLIEKVQNLVVEATNAEIGFLYQETFCGFSVTATPKEYEIIKNLSGVKKVYQAKGYGTLKLMLSNAVNTINLPPVYNLGYQGEGMAIAILDNGFYTAHEFFKLTDESSAKYKLTDMETLLEQELIAKDKIPSLKSSQIYKNPKVPFAFDYGNGDVNPFINHHHGTMVSGAAAGNGLSRWGVAKEAQLIMMKVANDNGLIYEDTILAAFEDAVKLGVDAVNISIGSDSGFTHPQGGFFDFNMPFSLANQAGIVVSVSAGNAGRLGENGIATTWSAYPKTTNTDYGTIASPSTSFHALSVGSNSNKTAWGPTPDLKLKPDLVAPGYLTSSNQNNGYSTSEGTSYASPLVAGGAAVLKQYLNSAYPHLSPDEKPQLIQQLMMSTAEILKDGSIPKSPRKQGSGLLNLGRAVSAKAVLIGSENQTKITLGDGLTQSFQLSFRIKNFSAESCSFNPEITVISDQASGGKIMESSKALALTNVTFRETDILVLPGKEKEIQVSVTLVDEALAQQLSLFPNGFYVEGYISLISSDQICPNLNIPFLGYYGDWAKPPIFIPTSYTTPFGPHDKLSYLGDNLFDKKNTYQPENIAFSPNQDGTRDSFGLYFSLFRNIKRIDITIFDENNTPVKQFFETYLAKTHPLYYLELSSLWWDGRDQNSDPLPEGNYRYEAKAIIDYPGAEADPQTFSFPVLIDNTPPNLLASEVALQEGKTLLQLTFKDNHGVQMAAIKKLGVGDWEQLIPIHNSEPNQAITVSFDITDSPNSQYVMDSYDYALNTIQATLKPYVSYVAYYKEDQTMSKITRENGYYDETLPEILPDSQILNQHAYAMVYLWDENMQPLKGVLRVENQY